jgi:hypothetical protein
MASKWKIAFHDSSCIRGMVHSLEKVTPRAEFKIKKEKMDDGSGKEMDVYFMCVDAMDVAQVCQLKTKLRLELSENIPDDLAFTLDCKELLNAFDIMLPEFAIFFEGEVGNHLILLKGYEADHRSHEVRCTLNTYVLDDVSVTLPKFDFQYLLEIDLQMMKKNLRNVQKLNSELVKFQLFMLGEEPSNDEKSMTILSWEGRSRIEHIMYCATFVDPDDGSITVRTVGDMDCERTEESWKLVYEDKFTADKLEMFVKALSGGPNAKLQMELTPTLPMNIVYNIGDESNGSHITMLLAPRNGGDDDMDD